MPFRAETASGYVMGLAHTSRLATSEPSVTSPKTTCLPSSQLVITVVMKNWEPLVFGPAFAMDRRSGLSCLSLKFSSLNLAP